MATRTELKICHENTESIGRPIFDRLIQLFLNSEHEGLIQTFPELQQWMTPEICMRKSTAAFTWDCATNGFVGGFCCKSRHSPH